MLHRHWASGPDQAIAGLRYVGLLSGVETPHPLELKQALSTIVAAGPHTRVGLNPQPGKRMWTYDPAAEVPVHQLPDEVAEDSHAAVLQHIRGRPGHRRPLEVHVSHRHIALDADHGLGDGRFTLELISALFALSAGRSCPWVSNKDTPLALPAALFRTFGIHPTRVQTAWRCATGLHSANSAQPAAHGGESVPWSPSLAVAVAQVSADAEFAVNEWRRAHAEQSGSAAVWLYIVRKALHAAGLPMTDKVMVAIRLPALSGEAANDQQQLHHWH